jgi:hypothetical protein
VSRLLDQLLGGEVITFDQFMAATPDERYQYLTDNQYTRNGTASGARAAAAALRNITADPGQIRSILQNSGLDQGFADATGGELGGIITAQQQDNGDFLTDNGWMLAAPFAAPALAPTLGAVGSGAAAGAMGSAAGSGGDFRSTLMGAGVGGLGGWIAGQFGFGADDLGNASGGGTASAGTGAGENGMWDWLDSFVDNGDVLDPTGLGAGDMPGLAGNADILNGAVLDPTGLGAGDLIFDNGSWGLPKIPMQDSSWLELAKKYGGTAVQGLRALMGDASGGATRSTGGGMLDLFRSNPGEALFNSTPFLLALAEANRQSDDLNGVIGKINGDAYSRSVLNPYDMDTAMGRTNLMQDQTLRGVRGSSFGNNDITNYDYMRSLGRGDLFNRANVATAGLEGNLINQRNTNRNLLLGAGLNASGRMFQPQSDPFGLDNLRRMGVL